MLDFDHERGEKLGNVAGMMGKVSDETLIAEMDKCAVRCANCHRRITHARRLHMLFAVRE